MKLRLLVKSLRSEGKVIACFGKAALIRKRSGTWHLQGGSREEQSMAREWISLFMHEVVLSRN